MKKLLLLLFLLLAASCSTDQTASPFCDSHVITVNHGDWTRLRASVVYYCQYDSYHEAWIYPFIRDPHVPDPGGLRSYIECGSALKFDFAIQTVDLSNLVVDAYMKNPDESTMFCESPEYPN
jgi:hypothetical protein